MFPRILSYLEGGNTFNAFNFSLDYNDLSGANYTAASQVINGFICPSSTRNPDGGRDAMGDPNGAPFEAAGPGYGVTDYGATCYTDIDPQGLNNPANGATPVVPYRNKYSRADGLLKLGFTRLSECTDGLSNTISIAEDAGRDATFVSQYAESYYGGNLTPPVRNVPGFAAGAGRRFWRWAEPHCSLGVAGMIDNPSRPAHETHSTNSRQGPWGPRATRRAITSRSFPSTPAGSMPYSVTVASISSSRAPTSSPCVRW